MLSGAVLHAIAKELCALIEAADAEHPVDMFELSVIARRVESQAEMLEGGLLE